MTAPASTKSGRRRRSPRAELLALAQDADELTELLHKVGAGLLTWEECEDVAGRLTALLLEGRRREHTRRTREGVARARREGKRFGRPPALTPDQIAKARRMRVLLGCTHRELARVFGCGQSTIRRAMDPL